MKVLFNKLKKANKVCLTIYIITLLAYLVSYILLVINLIGLSGIETVLRIVFIVLFGIWFFGYLLWNLINLILKKHIVFSVTSVITIILIIVFGFANYYVKVLYTGLGNLAEKEYVTYTTNLVTLKDTVIDEDSTLGMIDSTDDIEGNILAKELIEEEGLESNEVISYVSYYEMIYDLLNGEVDGIFLSSNYMTLFGEEEGFEELDNTVVAYTYSKKMENQDTNIVSDKSLTEPFTILLMGVDSTADGLDANAAFNGDTLMLITFNPNTLNATVFSIPRDTYVPIACNNNRYAKINSSAAYGTSCVIDTIEQMTGVDIDYYVKVNFKAVVDLVEAIDGIDVEVEAPDYMAYYKTYDGKICEQNSKRQKGENLVCIESGMQHLNGEQALAYARCRHAFLQSDIARNRHQQQIVEAIAKQLISSKNINRIEEILNAITNNLATNMSQKQILSFYDVMKDMVSKSMNDGDFITIQKTYLEYYSLPVKLSNNGMFTSAIGYYPGSLEAIVNLMKVNLELEEKESIKTFSFDANEEYTENIVGKGITTGDKLQTVPSFIGKSLSVAQTWADENDVTLKVEYVDSDSPQYNSSINAGLIANQSVSQGILALNVSEMIIYINNASEPENNSNSNPSSNPTTDTSTNKPNTNNTNSSNNTNTNTNSSNNDVSKEDTTTDNDIDSNIEDMITSKEDSENEEQ